MELLLEINDLRIQFAAAACLSQPVVDGVNLAVGSRETVILAGESGSGKTLTALSVARLLPRGAVQSSGMIRLNAREVGSLSASELTRLRLEEVAYIFQEPGAYLNPVYTAGEQVAEVIMARQGASRRTALAEVRRLFELVCLPDPGRVEISYPHQLSGGMNQRVCIAMALASRPKLLIADEPTTALDVTIEAGILDLLAALKEQFGFSMLFITHNLSIARRIADRIYVMQRGRIVEEGGVQEIFSRPQADHTRQLIRAYEEIGTLSERHAHSGAESR
jgi:ABC-type dipeptide/oligopeptide/nickel transport system ATPase component